MAHLEEAVQISYSEVETHERNALKGQYYTVGATFFVPNGFTMAADRCALMEVVHAPRTGVWTVRQLIRPGEMMNLIDSTRARRWSNRQIDSWIADTSELLRAGRLAILEVGQPEHSE